VTAQLEVCVVDMAGVTAATNGGADRLELCAALEIGGVTPTRGFVGCAQPGKLPTVVLIRPRGGDFVYSSAEIDIMLQDISDFSGIGVDGFVIGALTTESTLDLPILRTLIEACNGDEVTLHRAFDQVVDQELALSQAIDLGFHRILTSGGRSTVIAGLEQLGRLSRKANRRIRIVPGGGILPSNLLTVLASLKPAEVHASCRNTANESSERCTRLGSMGNGRTSATDLATVRALAKIIGAPL
jgi:copper homeostasis protein